MSPQLPAMQDALHLQVRRPPVYTGHLTPAACHLLDYLQERAVRYPSPLWFGSRMHLAMMSNMAQERSDGALLELIDLGLLTRVAPRAEPLAGSNEEGGAV